MAALASPAGAEDAQPPPVPVSFESSPGCGSLDALLEGVHERIEGVRLVEQKPSVVRWSLRQESNSVRARLVVLLEGGEELSREVEAGDCEAAVEALAFISAVALDPGAEEPLEVRQLVDEPPSAPPPPVEEPTTREWFVGVMGELDFGVAPGPLYGGGLFLSTSLSRGGFWAPGALLRARYGRSAAQQEALGQATFELFALSGAFCPSQLGGAEAHLSLCALVEGGALRAVGSEIFAPQTSLRAWVSAGPWLSAAYNFWGKISLVGQGGVAFPVIRDAFQFDDQVFHRVSPVVGSASLGLALKFR